MAKLGKLIAYIVAGIVGLFVIAAVALTLFFDPNDFRDEIAAGVKDATGRELNIEGDITLSVFPWLAVEVGQTALGNADGFGEAPFARFDNARLSVRVMPLLLRQEVAVGTASLSGFEANLAVAANGATNWDDLSQASEQTDSAPAESSGDFKLDIANVDLSNARVTYTDAQSGGAYSITDLNVATGRITIGSPFDVDGEFSFAAEPGDMGGQIALQTTVTLGEGFKQIATEGLNISGSIRGLVAAATDFNFDSRAMRIDTEAGRASVGEIDLGILGLAISADVEPFAYAGSPEIPASVRVAEFSLIELLQLLEIEPPVTADPNALQRVSFEANAVVGGEAISLADMALALDDTTMQGELAVMLGDSGPSLNFDLNADSITLDNYMAPPAEEAAAQEEAAADFEIPVDLVRALKANGTVRLQEAFLGPIAFTNLELGVNGSGDRLRLHPIAAEFFGGAYAGDVRIDASNAVPALSVNEQIQGVDLKAMAIALYETDRLTGTINGAFELAGSGQTMSAIASDLDGSMNIELVDGAWEGIDVWHKLRSARAIYKREPAPEAQLPLRTEFSTISATGVVTDGVFTNDDLLAQMPFLRITGQGTVNLSAREIDYSVQARVLERPEFMADASDDELQDFTQALIPIRIRGPLGDPSFRPDIEAMFRAEVETAIEEKKDELKEDLLNRLLGGDEEDAAGEGADTGEEEKDLEDELKDSLKNLFPR